MTVIDKRFKMDDHKSEWNKSYENKDNFVFYPHEEIIRFVSKNIRKQVGLDMYEDIHRATNVPRILDLGCGIGRHVIYCNSMGLDAYGVDLSTEAITFAADWATSSGMKNVNEKIKNGDIRNLCWDDGFFDYVVSHGVLDSMSYDIAKRACTEVARIIKPNGLFYCDVISGDDSAHCREFSGEEIVETTHENGTVQLYFNFSMLKSLFEDLFEIVECNLIRRENVIHGKFTSRYHLVLKSKV